MNKLSKIRNIGVIVSDEGELLRVVVVVMVEAQGTGHRAQVQRSGQPDNLTTRQPDNSEADNRTTGQPDNSEADNPDNLSLILSHML